MKRRHLLIAVAVAFPVLFSCNGLLGPASDPVETQTELSRTFRFGDNIISTNSNGDFVAVLASESLTKSGDGCKVVTGSYSPSLSGKAWSFDQVGKLELLADNKIAYTSPDGTRKVYDVELTGISAGSGASRIIGSWTVKETIGDYRGVNYSMDGLDLNEAEEMISEQGYELNLNLDADMVVTRVIITDSLVGAELENGKPYAAEHNLTIGSSFHVKECSSGLEGSAKFQYVDDFCVLTIDTVIEDYPARLLLTLQELK